VTIQESLADKPENSASSGEPPRRSPLMHPAFFIPAFTFLGLLFAAQEWNNAHHMNVQLGAALVFESWGLQYFLWGVIWWVLLRLFRRFIQEATVPQMVTIVLPAGLAITWLEEMIWAPFFPRYMGSFGSWYWSRVQHEYVGDLVESMAIFWGGFFFFRGVAYYQQLRENERVASQLEAQLANAKIAALRMQLNPHFLFNTMNSISSLMRMDVEAADSMLEHLSSLLRMTFERGDVQMIPLHNEIEFTETYLAMQDRRYAGRVTRTLNVDPDLHDALVPAMILQPIVENAYAHGLSKLDRGGTLSIDVRKSGQQLRAVITNNGVGLQAGVNENTNGHGFGLANVKDRLRLHYGENCTFSIRELKGKQVQVALTFPMLVSSNPAGSFTRYGA
jgi:two-component system, LytTR family, sensor kinase